MRIILIILGALLFFMPLHLYAETDSQMRAEILGEQGGKVIAADYSEYQPDKAKEDCRVLFKSLWEEHFKEMGFETGEDVVDSYVSGCMKQYNKKFGK
jgi:hypothetical protein